MFKVGPIGSKNTYRATSWDEKGHTKISNILFTCDDYGITSIQFSYSDQGAHVLSQPHGSSKGHKYQMIKLKQDEYVTGLSGIDFDGQITDLKIYTNQRKHKPIYKKYEYLKTAKREINVKIHDPREFGGFFGSFSNIRGCLVSIGIYFNPIASNNALLRTNFEATYNHQLALGLLPDPTDAITHNRTPKTVDGFPVNSIRCKPKLKDRILSKFDFKKAISNLLKKFFD